MRKPLDQFNSNRSRGKTYHHSRCKLCQREAWLQRNYGIGLSEYTRIWEQQNQQCALAVLGSCSNDREDRLPGVDHDHGTGVVRGILCWRHNNALGALGDCVSGLEIALQYVRGSA